MQKRHNAIKTKKKAAKENMKINLNENAENREFVAIDIKSQTLINNGSDIRTITGHRQQIGKTNFQLRQCALFAQKDLFLSIACLLCDADNIV